jgi:hypothetical protein
MITTVLSFTTLGDAPQNRTNPICVANHKCNKANQGKNACDSTTQWSPLYFPWLPSVMRHKIEPFLFVLHLSMTPWKVGVAKAHCNIAQTNFTKV